MLTLSISVFSILSVVSFVHLADISMRLEEAMIYIMVALVLLVCTHDQPYKLGPVSKASKKTDFTVDLTWWGLLRLTPIRESLLN